MIYQLLSISLLIVNQRETLSPNADASEREELLPPMPLFDAAELSPPAAFSILALSFRDHSQMMSAMGEG